MPSTSIAMHLDRHLLEEIPLSHFGDLVRTLRMARGLTMAEMARKIGSAKGYISGIEGGKVPPPSVKIITKYAKALGQDVRDLVRLAWIDKAPSLMREEAQRFLQWYQAGMPGPEKQE